MKNLLKIFMLIIVASNCTSAKKENTSLASIYSQNENYFINHYSLLSLNDTVSELTIAIHTDKLLFIKNNDDNQFKARYKLHYSVFESFTKKTITDSTTLEYTVNKENQEKLQYHHIKFLAKKGKNYFLELLAKDLQRNSSFSIIIDVLKKENTSQSYFSTYQNNQLITPPFALQTNTEVNIVNKEKINSKIFLKTYQRNLKLPLPPFDLSTPEAFNHTPDSLIILYSDSTGLVKFTPHAQGFYHLQHDTSTSEGLCLFSFEKEFPYLVHRHQLLEPLAYLTTEEEFKKLQQSTDLKKSIDKFWEENCGSKERAKESINLYYTRIEEANRFFTSYREGWRTDRGMIYIIFGAPKLIYRTNESEKWFYGDENNILTEEYTFYKINNPYSSNAYNLVRSGVYKTLWYKMIEAWRDGRIY